jgi:hypothetical protein
MANNAIITIDFDAAQTFGHEAGKSGQWIMHPVLFATTQTIRLGRITGNVTLAQGVTLPACGGGATKLSVFKPLAIATPDTLSGVTDTLGVYNIANVVPKAYTLSFAKDITYTNGDSLTFTAAATPASVTVAQGDSAKSNYQISAVSCH